MEQPTWGDLPPDILGLVAAEASLAQESLATFAAIRRVCRAWRRTDFHAVAERASETVWRALSTNTASSVFPSAEADNFRPWLDALSCSVREKLLFEAVCAGAIDFIHWFVREPPAGDRLEEPRKYVTAAEIRALSAWFLRVASLRNRPEVILALRDYKVSPVVAADVLDRAVNSDIAVLRALCSYGLTADDVDANVQYVALEAGRRVDVYQVFYSDFGLRAKDLVADTLVRVCAGGHVELLELLVSQYKLTAADARADDNAALRAAAKAGHSEILQKLHDVFGSSSNDSAHEHSESSANDSAHEYSGSSANDSAHEHSESSANDSAHGHGLNAEDARARSNAALFEACRRGHAEVIRVLRTAYCLNLADVHAIHDALRELFGPDSQACGSDFLRELCRRRQPGNLAVFPLANGSTIFVPREAPPEPQRETTSSRFIDVLHELLAFGLTAADIRAYNIFDFAVSESDVELLALLARSFGFTAADARADNNAALRRAAGAGNLAMLHVLAADYGLGPDDARSNRNSALAAAASAGRADVLELLAAEFKLTTADARARQDAAFFCAVTRKHADVLEVLARTYGLAEAFRAEDYAPLRLLVRVPSEVRGVLTNTYGFSALLIDNAGGNHHADSRSNVSGAVRDVREVREDREDPTANNDNFCREPYMVSSASEVPVDTVVQRTSGVPTNTVVRRTSEVPTSTVVRRTSEVPTSTVVRRTSEAACSMFTEMAQATEDRFFENWTRQILSSDDYNDRDIYENYVTHNNNDNDNDNDNDNNNDNDAPDNLFPRCVSTDARASLSRANPARMRVCNSMMHDDLAVDTVMTNLYAETFGYEQEAVETAEELFTGGSANFSARDSFERNATGDFDAPVVLTTDRNALRKYYAAGRR